MSKEAPKFGTGQIKASTKGLAERVDSEVRIKDMIRREKSK